MRQSARSVWLHFGVFDYVKSFFLCGRVGEAVATNRPMSNSRSTPLLSVVLVVAVLYFAREIFIPIALAILFSFLLAPLVTRLRHWGLWRMPAILIVVTSSFALMTVIGTIVTIQLTDLGRKMPEYQHNV